MTAKDLRTVASMLGCVALIAALATLLIGCMTVPVRADGLPKTSKIWSPLDQPAATVTVKQHNLYIGAIGNYAAWQATEQEGSPSADDWQLSFLAGYLYRSGGVTGWAGGVEIEWTPHELTRLRDDDGVLMIRGRAGAFVSSKTFIYGTAGFLLDKDELSGLVTQGPVVGAGVEVDITANLALRAEVLHLRYGRDYLDWGDEGDTKLRAGAVVKF